MTPSLPDAMFIVTIVMGLMMIVGFLIVAGRSKSEDRHPEGRRGRLRDEALRAAPILPYFAIMLCGWAFESFHARDTYLWLLGASVVAILLADQIPVVKHARARLKGLERYPSQ